MKDKEIVLKNYKSDETSFADLKTCKNDLVIVKLRKIIFSGNAWCLIRKNVIGEVEDVSQYKVNRFKEILIGHNLIEFVEELNDPVLQIHKLEYSSFTRDPKVENIKFLVIGYGKHLIVVNKKRYDYIKTEYPNSKMYVLQNRNGRGRHYSPILVKDKRKVVAAIMPKYLEEFEYYALKKLLKGAE